MTILVKLSHNDHTKAVHIPFSPIGMKPRGKKVPLKFDGKEVEMEVDQLMEICQGLVSRAMPGAGMASPRAGMNLSTVCKIEVNEGEKWHEYDIEKFAKDGLLQEEDELEPHELNELEKVDIDKLPEEPEE